MNSFKKYGSMLQNRNQSIKWNKLYSNIYIQVARERVVN